MKRLAMMCAAVVMAACGGQESDPPPVVFAAEHAVAELRDGVPHCEPGKTGTGLVAITPDPASAFSEIAVCRWTCAELFGQDREAVSVWFGKMKDDGKWTLGATRDGDGFGCP